jgi:catechol 2,3-dioxygenase-like lactoylglutathione lyase family enzyme
VLEILWQNQEAIMRFSGICITTNNAPRLAEFYKIVLQEEPLIEGSHYGFDKLAVYDPGDVELSKDKHIWLQCFDKDIDALYERLLQEIPDIEIISPPERKPWGAYSFWFTDPDGNKIAVAQE